MAKKPVRSTANDATAAGAPAVSKPRGRTTKLSSQAARPEAISPRSFDAPTDEQIRARAYEMYLERGGHHGLDFDDWVRAERELKRRQ